METINDALIQAVKDLGGSKIVGPLLWPELLIDQAQKKLLDCLNPDRPHHLTPEQASFVLRKAKEAGKHEAMEFVCSYIGYSKPTPIEPQDEKARLQKDFIAAQKAMVVMLAKNGEAGMNAFSGYVPQLSWRGHDKFVKQFLAGTKGAAAKAAKIHLPGSLNGKVLMMDISSRDIINDDKTLQRDRTDMIRRGGR